jgi:uncharacterized protein
MDYTAHKTEYVLRLIENDAWMKDVLRTVRDLQLPDWWVAAGFVRNRVWDDLHGYSKRTAWQDMDVDVVYFDPKNIDSAVEKEIELRLFTAKPGVPWSVKNQARMHAKKSDDPYASTIDAISRWVETATCVGVRLDADDKIELFAPHVADMVNMVLRPNPQCRTNPQDFERRLIAKHWLRKWPKLKIALHNDISNSPSWGEPL